MYIEPDKALRLYLEAEMCRGADRWDLGQQGELLQDLLSVRFSMVWSFLKG